MSTQHSAPSPHPSAPSPQHSALSTQHFLLSPHRTADVLLPGGLCLALLLFYLAASQPIPTFDTRVFLHSYASFHHKIHPHHPLFGYVLAPWLLAGRAAGLSLMTAGMLQSAAFAALSAALFHAWLRRHGLSRATALLFSVLLGLNASVIDVATTTEMYAACLFAVVLSLWAFDSVSRNPGRLNAFFLWICCFSLFALHVGFAFWVMALYLTLAWRGRRRPLNALAWILQAAAIPALLLLWLVLAGAVSASQAGATKAFFGRFWMQGEDGVLRRIVAAPLYQFAMYAGFILFPAWVGWKWFRSRLPGLATAACLATLLFFMFYAFWVADRGVFYLPLLPLWGLFAALAVQKLAGKANGRPVLLVAGGVGYSVLFMLLPALPAVSRSPALSWVLAFSYPAFCVCTYLLMGHSPRGGEDPPPAPTSTPAPKAMAVYACVAVLVSLAVYLPHVVQKRKPDVLTLFYRAVQANTPANARYVTLLSEMEGLRPAVQAERECFIVDPNEWDAAKARQLTQWLVESAQPGGAPVFFNQGAFARREDLLWRLEPGIGTPLADWAFTPVSVMGENTEEHVKEATTIFRVRKKDP